MLNVLRLGMEGECLDAEIKADLAWLGSQAVWRDVTVSVHMRR